MDSYNVRFDYRMDMLSKCVYCGWCIFVCTKKCGVLARYSFVSFDLVIWAITVPKICIHTCLCVALPLRWT